MNDRLPLTEVSGDEILARVTFQIILHDYHLSPDKYDDPTGRLLELACEWDDDLLSWIHEQLTLCAIWVGNGGTVATWLRARIVITTGRATKLARIGRRR